MLPKRCARTKCVSPSIHLQFGPLRHQHLVGQNLVLKTGTLGKSTQCSQGEVPHDEIRDCTALGGIVAVIRPQEHIPNEEL
jgi:hypothetical protein